MDTTRESADEPYFPDEVVRAILLLLAVVDVLRNRVVCKRWKQIIDEGSFGQDYARGSSASPIFFFRRDVDGDSLGAKAEAVTAHVDLEALNLAALKPQRLLQFSDVPTAKQLGWENVLVVEGSCDGILLLSWRDRLYACNPYSRRWAGLPPMHVNRGVIGFYAHRPPGEVDTEYRVLYREVTMRYAIHALNTGDVRILGLPATLPPELSVLWSEYGLRAQDDPPVRIGDNLYWRPQQDAEPLNFITVFNVAMEEFGWICPPVDKQQVPQGGHLFTMDEALAMAATDVQEGPQIAVWILINGNWSKKYSVILPIQEMNSRLFLLDQFCNTPVLITQFDSECHVLVQCLHHLLQCSHSGHVLERHSCGDSLVLVTHHMIHESVAGFPFLRKQEESVDEDGYQCPFKFKQQL